MSLLDTILRRPPGLSCQEMVELMTAYLEGTLDARDRARFGRHVAACNDCARYLDQMRDVVAVTGRVPVETLPPQAIAELRAAFRHWHDDQEEHDG